MRIRTILLIVVAVLVTAFLIVNWPVLEAPAQVSFFVTSAALPIGIVMLGLLALLMVTLSAYVAVWQRTLLIEYRRQSKELETQRAIADDAEASRFTEMGNLLRAETANLGKRFETSLSALAAEFHTTENSISAILGEMDDRIRGINSLEKR